MARRRSTIAKKVTFDMNAMAAHVYGMTDEELGKWMHKAIKDCIEGCVDPDTDCFVKRMYEESYDKMQQRQNINVTYHQNRLARQKNSGKPNHDKTNDPVLTAPSAGGSCATFATTSLTETSTDKTDAGAHSVRGTPDNAAPASNLLPIDNTKKLYGRFRHVRLSDEDGRELREEFGPRLKDAIEMLDNYIESLPSKKAGEKKCGVKYWQEDYERKNHKLCMLRWVKRAMDENETVSLNKKAAEARLKKAESTPKSFQQQDLDARTKFFSTSVVDKMLANED